MRIAFLSDIHGNYTALQAVLADMEAQRVDSVISLGDTITMGPQPMEVLAKLRALDCIYIKGNHDFALLDPAQAEHYQIAKHLQADLRWCAAKLTPSDREFIDAFRATYQFEFPNGVSVLCFHGSPLSCTDLIQSTTSPRVLDQYFGGRRENIFIGGHSHIQMHRRYGGQLILNAGSVGNAFVHAYRAGNIPVLLPWAEYAILSQKGESLDIDLRRVYFDTAELLKIVGASDLPGADWWLKQYQQAPAAMK